MVNVKESKDKLKYLALTGCWNKLCSAASNDFQEFCNKQGEIRNTLILVYKVLREGVPDLEEANILEFMHSRITELTEEDPEELMVLSQTKGEGDSKAVVERP
jgi:hypothetical protein